MTTRATDFRPIDEQSASGMSQAEAIQFHYDNDTDFFSLWLDPTLSYSAARWFDPLTGSPCGSTLHEAQINKIGHHLSAARVREGSRLLDVGCGWGAVLHSAVADRGARSAVGLTLSTHQLDYIKAQNWPGVTALLQDVFEYTETEPFDAAVSIGAFEHFAKPHMDRAEKIETYRRFFGTMAAMMPREARFSLQTIVWDAITFEEAKTRIPQTVFPQSDLPFIDEVAEGANPTFRLVHLENDPTQYTSTLSAWIATMREHRATISERWGEEKFHWFQGYLRRSRLSFQRKYTSLSRMVFERR